MVREAKSIEALDPDRDMPLQRRTWAAERIGWAVMGIAIIAALAGAFSDGPLSAAETSDPTAGLTLQYQRFERYHAPAFLRIALLGEGEAQSLSFNQAFLDSVRILRIVPEPVGSTAGAAGYTFHFGKAALGEAAAILVFFEPERFGVVRGEVAVAGRPPLRFTQWVYP
jgi:hypothetical protein